jgi:hypothetical protein
MGGAICRIREIPPGATANLLAVLWRAAADRLQAQSNSRQGVQKLPQVFGPGDFFLLVVPPLLLTSNSTIVL